MPDPALTPQALASYANRSPFAVPGAAPPPPHVTPKPRQQILSAADWTLIHKANIDYSENVDPHAPNYRWRWHDRPHFDLGHRLQTDCSGWATMLHWLAGAPDPSGSNWAPGNTATMLAHCGTPLAHSQVVPGDLCVYGAGGGAHVSLVVGLMGTTDFWEIGHGYQGAPSRGTHSATAAWFAGRGNPQVRFLRVPGLAL